MSTLAQSNDTEMRRLGELLQDFEKHIAAAAPSLPAEDKALAKEKVQEIAAAAAKPEDGALRRTGRAAMLVLTGLAASLPDINKIVEAVGKILESVGKFVKP